MADMIWGIYEVVDLVLCSFIEAMRLFKNPVKYEIVGPLKIEGAGNASSTRPVGVVRSYVKVEESAFQFVLEVVQLVDGVIDVMLGVLPAEGTEVKLTEIMRHHMEIVLTHGWWDSESFETVDCREYKTELGRNHISTEDWLFLMRLDSLSSDDLLIDSDCPHPEDPFDYWMLGGAISKFIHIFCSDGSVESHGNQ